MPRPKIVISKCLLGQKVRYDGNHKLDQSLVDWLRTFAELVPVCPEVECGLPVPREPMLLESSKKGIRLITNKTRIDYTDQVQNWISAKLVELEKQKPCAAVLKSKSPCCGVRNTPIEPGTAEPGALHTGLFAQQIMQTFPAILVEGEDRLQSPIERAKFKSKIPK